MEGRYGGKGGRKGGREEDAEKRWREARRESGLTHKDTAKVGVNPKVNNLIEPFARAKYDILWVLDATISTTPDVLGRMVDAFIARKGDEESSPLIGDEERKPPQRGEVGLVHQVPTAVVYNSTWGSLIEQAYLNSTHAKMYLSIVSVAHIHIGYSVSNSG